MFLSWKNEDPRDRVVVNCEDPEGGPIQVTCDAGPIFSLKFRSLAALS